MSLINLALSVAVKFLANRPVGLLGWKYRNFECATGAYRIRHLWSALNIEGCLSYKHGIRPNALTRWLSSVFAWRFNATAY